MKAVNDRADQRIAQTVEPITGKPLFLRPGSTRVRLGEEHRRAYRRLYGLQFPLAGVPALKDHDFDGRSITVTTSQLAALNRAFASLHRQAESGARNSFGGQERFLTEHFQEMQFLS